VAFILIVEPDECISKRAADALTAAGHACGCVANADQARTLLRWRNPELMVIDRDLAAICADALFDELEPHRRDIPIVTLSAVAGAGDGIGKVAHGEQDCIRKPFEPRFLAWRVEHALEVHAAKARRADIEDRRAALPYGR
jgi:two-component system phosphate regulon response regulator PhoB